MRQSFLPPSHWDKRFGSVSRIYIRADSFSKGINPLDMFQIFKNNESASCYGATNEWMKKTQHARVFTLCVSIYSIICNTFIRKENDTRKNIWWSECKHLQRLKWRNYNDQIYFVNIGTCGLHTFYSCMKNDKKFISSGNQ